MGRAARAALIVAIALSTGTGGNTKPVAITLSSWLKATFPTQAAAKEYSTNAASKRWALLIGINDYASPTRDNVGSRQDAVLLRTILLRLGWRSDHIILLTDRAATAQHIIDTLRWLELKTTYHSRVVFHYAGHENYTRTLADGDNETKDVEIWAADNRYIIDGTLGKELGRVRDYRMWIDITTCRATGFNDPGMFKTGRVLTYSSTISEWSYEDPTLHYTVFGWYMLYMGMYRKEADANHDGKVAVEEAFAYARKWTPVHTGGKQYPVKVDYVTGNLILTN